MLPLHPHRCLVVLCVLLGAASPTGAGAAGGAGSGVCELNSHDITPRQIESYRRNGFIVIDDFWTPAELEEWRAAVEEVSHRRCCSLRSATCSPPAGAADDTPLSLTRMQAVEERPRQWKFPRLGQEDIVNEGAEEGGDSFYENVFVQRINLWATNQRVKDLWLKYGQEIGRVAAVLEGVDGIRIWHDQALVKEPWANPTTLHVDNPFWPFSSPNACSIWMPLDDVDEQNGALFFLPGSHRFIEQRERAKHDAANVTAATTPYETCAIGKNMGESESAAADCPHSPHSDWLPSLPSLCTASCSRCCPHFPFVPDFY
jgi:hypothetical protein